MEALRIVPYEFRSFDEKFIKHLEEKGLSSVGYLVMVYFVFDGKNTYSFFRRSDAHDNYMLAREVGQHVLFFWKEIVVTPLDFPDIYNSIEQYVSETNFNKKC